LVPASADALNNNLEYIACNFYKYVQVSGKYGFKEIYPVKNLPGIAMQPEKPRYRL